MPIDPNEAPEGYKAIHGDNGCLGCCFLSGGCLGCARMHCDSEHRKDGCEVVFVAGSATSKPTVKLPQRYEVVSSGCASEEDDGQWMRAEDVISELNAAGIAWERSCRGQ